MSKRKVRAGDYEGPAAGWDRSDRWEAKRRRFAEERRGPRPLGPRFYLTAGVIGLVVVFVGLMTFQNTGTAGPSAAALQQQPASTAATEGGKVSISVQEVTSKKLVAWDYKKGNITTPLLAYTTPSGAVKVASRMCEPCNSTSFRVEGTQLVCNACGSRWELENSKGISGGCQAYPPEVLPSSVVDGKVVVDEEKVSTWKPRAF
ncbi:MAG: Fe-S-containing protein [Sphingomonadaceae bacterium]